MKSILLFGLLLFVYCSSPNKADERFVGTWSVDAIILKNNPNDTGLFIPNFDTSAYYDSISKNEYIEFLNNNSFNFLYSNKVIQSGFWKIINNSLNLFNLTIPSRYARFCLFEGDYSAIFTTKDSLPSFLDSTWVINILDSSFTGNLLVLEHGLINSNNPYVKTILQKQ